MRKIIVAAATAGLLALAGPAFAGPEGTADSENPGTRQVQCGASPGSYGPVPGTNLQVNTAGGPEGGAAVVCNDGDELPIQGRIIASGSTTGGGWVAADGDPSNPSQGQGWARVDFGTGGVQVRCDNNTNGGQNSEQANSNGGHQSHCGQ